MDLVNSHRRYPLNSEHGIGLLDLPNDSITSTQDDYPARPSSRLGFNRTSLSTTSSEAFPGSEVVQWSHSLFQNLGISDLRMSSTIPYPPTKDLTDPGYLDSLENTRNEASFPSRNENIINPICQDGVNHYARLAVVPRKSPKSAPTSVSRLCFPFVTTPSPRRKPSPPPPPRHKYSCFPSLMSPVSPDRPGPRHQRHEYRHHGYSRTALQQVKWFWSAREEEWKTHKIHVHDPSGYGGVSPDGSSTPLPIHPLAPRPTHPAVSYQSPPPMTVHPRRGDIAALRDSYCMHIDRCFAGIPTWTISKTLWMLDLQMATKNRILNPVLTEDDSFDSDSESEMEVSSSTGFSDDSDATLVESESEMDLPHLLMSSKKMSIVNTDSEQGYLGQSSTFARQSTFFSDRGVLDNEAYFTRVKAVVANSHPLDSRNPQWATTWYQRWELLVELSRHNRDRRHALVETNDLPSETVSSNIPGRQFFSAYKSAELDDENDDAWNTRLERVEA